MTVPTCRWERPDNALRGSKPWRDMDFRSYEFQFSLMLCLRIRRGLISEHSHEYRFLVFIRCFAAKNGRTLLGKQRNIRSVSAASLSHLCRAGRQERMPSALRSISFVTSRNHPNRNAVFHMSHHRRHHASLMFSCHRVYLFPKQILSRRTRSKSAFSRKPCLREYVEY